MKIEIDGTQYELLTPDEMNMGLQRKFQKIAGVGPDRIVALVDGEYNPNVIVAWLAVSIWKEKPSTPIAQVEARLDELMPEELNAIFESLQDDEDGQSPPIPAESGGGPPTSGGSSEPASEPHPARPTPSPTGAPASDISAISDRRTSTG